MNKQLTLCNVGRMFALLLLTTFAFSDVLAQKQSSTKLSLSSQPYMETGYNRLPVLVTSVTTDLRRGTIATVGVQNSSSKELAKLKLAWYLSTEDEPTVILKQGETPWLRIPDGIESGVTEWVEFDLVSFSEFEQSLITKDTAITKYLIRVGVSEVQYTNKASEILLTSKSKKELPDIKYTKVAYLREPAAQTTFCPNQRCEIEYSPGEIPPRAIGHTCAGGAGTSCSNGGNGQTCTNTICARDPGPPRPPVRPIID